MPLINFDGKEQDLKHFGMIFKYIGDNDALKRMAANDLLQRVNRRFNDIDLEFQKHNHPNIDTIKNIEEKLAKLKPYVETMGKILAKEKQNPNIRSSDASMQFMQDRIKRFEGQLSVAKNFANAPPAMQRKMRFESEQYKQGQHKQQHEPAHRQIGIRRK